MQLAIEPETGLNSVRRADTTPVAAGSGRARIDLVMTAMLEAMPGAAMVLNEERRIVAANRVMLSAAGVSMAKAVLGMLPGAELGGKIGDDALVEAIRTRTSVTRECQVILDADTGTALDVEVFASPMSIDSMQFLLVRLRDISGETRRNALERTFLHDILNTAAGIHGMANLVVAQSVGASGKEFRDMLAALASRLIDEIRSQTVAMVAEAGELNPVHNPVSVPSMLRCVLVSFQAQEVALGRSLVIKAAPEVELDSDEVLVRRILSNMVKNALEASREGDSVALWAEDEPDHVMFLVENCGIMTADVRNQVFHRSFTTKGRQRGIGTYSTKLLGEGYLGGQVDFVDSESASTIFRLKLPKRWTPLRRCLARAGSDP